MILVFDFLIDLILGLICLHLFCIALIRDDWIDLRTMNLNCFEHDEFVNVFAISFVVLRELAALKGGNLGNSVVLISVT